jgi:hypothetical protein
LKYLPKLEAGVISVNLGERSDSQGGKVVEFRQTMAGNRTIPAEIVDGSFILQVDNRLLFVSGQTPVMITPYGTAQYLIPRTTINANQGARISIGIAVASITSDVWDKFGVGTKGSRTINTKVRCQGTLSGLVAEATAVISEEFVR